MKPLPRRQCASDRRERNTKTYQISDDRLVVVKKNLVVINQLKHVCILAHCRVIVFKCDAICQNQAYVVEILKCGFYFILKSTLCVQNDTKTMTVSLILTKLLSFKVVKLSEAEIAKMSRNTIQS